MSGRSYRLTALAEADIDDILAHTYRQFGASQLEIYSALIEKAAEMVGEAPLRPGSKAREELAPGVRSFHIELAARRRGAASHVIYYVAGELDPGRSGSIILRVLWDGMEPRSRILRGAADDG